MTDTTTKAVQQLADDIGKGRISRANTAAATLRALAQERDDAKADYLRRHQEAVANFHRAITAEAERDALAQERDELEAVFNKAWEADMRAIKVWQGANPGNDLVWPDRTSLVAWLLAERDAARAEVDRLREALENAASGLEAIANIAPVVTPEAIRQIYAWGRSARAALAAKGEA